MDTSFEADSGDLADALDQGTDGLTDTTGTFPVKKLSEVFDGLVATKVEECMKVYLRVRPSSAKLGSDTIEVESDTSIVTSAPESSKRAQYTKMERRHYAFTRVFGPDSTQDDIFIHTVRPLFERFVGGESAVLFAYGMTNAGKTYTIQGVKETPGTMPLLVGAVMQHLYSSGDSEWDLNISMLEIYQERIYDLLSEKKKKEKLNIRDGNGRVEVMGLSQHPIASAEDAMEMMETAMARRSNSRTHLNSGSSRSHAVYSLTLSRYVGGREIKSEFQVVDLAGAERGKRTQGTTSQQREANNINMSLMQLWRCLQAMGRRGHTPSDIVPFRESKLTHLLMPLLSRIGLAGVAMMTCVNPQNDDYDETVSILGNASLACKIQEIADLGRSTTVGVVGHQSHISNPMGNIRSHKQRNSSTDSHANHGKAHKKNHHHNGGGGRSSSLMSGTEDGTSSALKRLKEEVVVMRHQNEQLLREQAMREQEIREEVAEEMAERSAFLLEQIQELQDQVNSTNDSFYADVTKSVMKTKKKQLQTANDEIIPELQECVREMEDELRVVRENYDDEIALLKQDKFELEAALREWKVKAEEAILIAENITEEKMALQEQLASALETAASAVSTAVAVGRTSNIAPPAPTIIPAALTSSNGVSITQKAPAIPVPNTTEATESNSISSTITSEEAMSSDSMDTVVDSEEDLTQEMDIPAAPVTEEAASNKPPPAPVSRECSFECAENSPDAMSDSRNSTDSSRSSTSTLLAATHLDTVTKEKIRNSAASAFELRMKRDQRMKKVLEEAREQVEPVPETIEKNNSPVRSPLKEHDANSPKAPYNNENTSKRVQINTAANNKRALSPVRGRTKGQENVGVPRVAPPAKSPARKRVRANHNEDDGVEAAQHRSAAPTIAVKMTAKARAQAADQKAKAIAKEANSSVLGAPVARRLRSRVL
jgi:hypothetical protein